MNLTILAATSMAAVGATGLGGAPAGPTAAPAPLQPLLQTGQPCYLPGQPVRLTGLGFNPNSAYAVSLDRRPVGSGRVGAGGKLAGTLSSGTLDSGLRSRRRLVGVRNGDRRAHVGFEVGALGAGFAPAAGDPRTLKVHFSVFGVGVGASRGAVIYLHYIDPRGHLRRTIGVGRAAGACGSLERSSQLALFPFKTVRAGSWRLQFDLKRAYDAGAQPRITRLVRVR